jgi:two-component system chemotaxis response regulator CheY
VSSPRAHVVDDSRALRSQLRRWLEALGYEVLTWGDPLDALEALQADPAVRLCLVDLHMPDLDGITYTSVARRLRPNGDLTVILVTGDGRQEAQDAARHAGAAAHLCKPFSRDTLGATLRALGLPG